MSREPTIRLTRPDDINKLRTLDLKCYQYPMPLEEWQARVKGSGQNNEARIVLCEVMHMPSGFCMWNIDIKTMIARILRMGVLPKFRMNGIGRLLIENAVLDARKNQCDKIIVSVPHIHCKPQDADDVSVFLTRCNFSPNGNVIHEWCQMYGNMVDGYEFERKLDAFAPRL